MVEVGAFEAKTHFARLLERVAQGEEITITKHGNPVARLLPMGGPNRVKAKRAAERLKTLRRGQALGDLSWKDLRDEGRR